MRENFAYPFHGRLAPRLGFGVSLVQTSGCWGSSWLPSADPASILVSVECALTAPARVICASSRLPLSVPWLIWELGGRRLRARTGGTVCVKDLRVSISYFKEESNTFFRWAHRAQGSGAGSGSTMGGSFVRMAFTWRRQSTMVMRGVVTRKVARRWGHSIQFGVFRQPSQ